MQRGRACAWYRYVGLRVRDRTVQSLKWWESTRWRTSGGQWWELGVEVRPVCSNRGPSSLHVSIACQGVVRERWGLLDRTLGDRDGELFVCQLTDCAPGWCCSLTKSASDKRDKARIGGSTSNALDAIALGVICMRTCLKVHSQAPPEDGPTGSSRYLSPVCTAFEPSSVHLESTTIDPGGRL